MGSFIQEVLALIKRKEAIESLLPNRDYIRIGRERDSLLKTPAYVPEMEDHVIRADAFACSLLETILSADPNYIPVISTPPPDANCDAGFLVNSIIFQDPSTGKLRFDGYGSGTHTGTSTFMLAVDALGNVIEVISTDADTKYDLTASNPATDEIDLDLTGTDGTTDTVKFIGGTNINLSLSGNEVTIDGTDLNTTYTYDLNVVGQDHILELNGSDGSTDSITLIPGTNVTFNTVGDSITIESENTTYTLSFADPNITLTGSDGSTSIIDISSIDHNTTNVSLSLAGTVLILTDSDGNTVSQDLASIDTDTTNVSLTLTGTTLDLLDSAGNTVSANLSSLDNDTTYTLDAAQNTTNVDITLDASAGTDSTITLVAGTNIALTESTGNITIDATDTNTLYDISSSQATPTSNVVVTLNASGTDPDSTITLAAGPNVTLTDNGSNQITIDANADTDTTYTLGFSNPNITLTDSNGVVQSVNISSINTDTTNVQFYLIGTTLYLEDSAGNTINQNLASIDTNTTYALSSAQNGSDADIILTGTNPTSTDTVKLVAGNNITISNTGNNITINAAADTDTTYDLSGVGSTNGTAGVRLTGSDTTTDDVLIVGSGTTTVTRSLNTLTVTSNDQFVGTVTSVSAGTGIEITGTGTINPTVNIDYAGTNNAILVATSATPVGADTLWFSDATDNTIKKALISDMPGFGADGTVTSVALTETGTALTITGSPITTSGTINIAGAGSSSQVILGDLTLGTYTDGTVTSIGIAADNGAGTGITTSGTFTFTGGTNVTTSVTGNTVTINSTDQFTGTVTSVDVSGGTTGLTTSGGPITTSGTITIGGVLEADNGGTGLSSYTQGDMLYYNTSTTVLSKLGIGTNGQVLTVSGGLPTWADAAPGDITEVIAGTGLTGGGTSGSVTLNVGAGDGITVNANDVAVDYLGVDNVILSAADGSAVTLADNDQFIFSDDTDNNVKYASLSQLATYINAGTVTSVGLSIDNSTALAVDATSTPVTTTGTLALEWQGVSTQVVLGDGTLGTYNTGTMSDFTLAGDGGTPQTIEQGNTLTIAGGTYITTSAGATDTVTVTHDNTTRTDTTSSQTGTPGGSVTIIDSVTTNATGHVTAVNVNTLTLPSQITFDVGADSGIDVAIVDGNLIDINGGTALSSVIANSGNGASITINHDNFGTAGTYAYPSSITTNATGHITSITAGSAPGTVTSVGLSMPTAFTVTNSPVTTSGTLTVTGAGTTSQYIDGTGALQTFPTIPTVPTNIVETVTTTDGTFIDLTPNTATDGNVTVTAELSATGTPSATTYLRGDNTWATLPADLTGVNTLNSLDGDLTLAAGSNVTITDNGSNTITIASTDQFTGTVTSVGTSSSTFVDVTGGTITTTGTITAALSATGTPSATTYLRGDNTWASLPTDNNTTYTYSAAQSGSNVELNLVGSDATTDTVTLAAGTNVTLSEASDVVTITTDNTTNTSLVLSGNTLTLTDSDTNTVSADLSSLADSLWSEDTTNGYLYPNTLSHDVGIGTSTPSQKLHVDGGNILFNTNGDETLISNKQTSVASTQASNIFIGGGGQSITGTTVFEGSNNTSLGDRALLNITSGRRNTAVGADSGDAITTGIENVSVGYLSLGTNTTGSFNTAVGVGALRNSTGSSNTAIGRNALDQVTTGSNNVAIGYQAGNTVTTSIRGVYIGFDADASAATGVTNEIAIGYNTIGNGSNTATYGSNLMTKHLFQAGDMGIGTTSPSARVHIVGAGTTSSTSSLLVENSAGTDLLKVTDDGQAQLGTYGSGTFTGTTAYNLAVDSSGNVIEVSPISSPVDGSGTTNYLSKWLDSDTLTDSLAYDDGGGQFVFEGSFFTGQNVATDSTNKSIRFATKHYTNAEEPFVGLLATSTSSANIVEIGGGTSLGNAATTVSFRTASNNTTVTGTERMRINSSGNVGIGTTNPTQKLHIDGGRVLVSEGTNGYVYLNNTNNFLYGDTNNNVIIQGTSSIRFWQSAAEISRFDSSGNLGIATSSPSARLHVVGSGTTSATNSLLVENSSGTDLVKVTDDGTTTISSSSTHVTYFKRNATNIVSIVGSSSIGSIAYYQSNSPIWAAGINDSTNRDWVVANSSYAGGSNQYLKVKLGGGISFPAYTSTNFDGTPTSFLGVDASGNVIKTTSAGVLTPNLQEVTDEGNTTTNIISLVSDSAPSGTGLSLGRNNTGGYQWIQSFGSQPLSINPLGNNVGIGTTSPSFTLDVDGTFRSNAIWTSASAVTYWGAGGSQTVYGGLTWGTGYATVFSNSGNVLHLGASGASADVTIDTTGDVGIGTTSPAARTHIVGADDLFATKGLLVENSSGTDTFFVTNEGIAGFYKHGVTNALHITGKQTYSGNYSTLVGHQAGGGSGMTGSYQAIFGAYAGDLITGDSTNATIIGGAAGYQANAPTNSVMVGYHSGSSSDGNNNTFVGYYTRNQSGSQNVMIGRQAGDQSYGGQNVYIGSLAGYDVGASGNNSDSNVFIGYEAGRLTQDGVDRNIFLGYRAGYNTPNLGSGNTVIGDRMLSASTEALSNTVVIGAGANERLRIDSAGQMQLINYGSGTHTGTAAYGLAVDSSGEVIETTAPLTAVPNLQQVTNVGNTTTNSIRLTSGQYELYTGTTEIGVIKNTSGVFDIRTASTRDIKLGSTTYGDIMFLEGVDGSVGIGTNSPEERLHVEGNVRADSFGVEGSTTAHPTRVLAPAGAEYRNTGVVTGAIVVALPQSWTNTMLNFTVNLYDYSTNETIKIKVAGYNYAPSTQWFQTTAIVESSPVEDKNIRVRFGHDGTKCVVVIGDTTSTWEYPNASVSEFFAGHSNTELEKWNDGWDITLITTTDGYSFSGTDHTNTQVNNWARSGQDLYYGSGTGDVGINTSSPAAKLHVVGDGTTSATDSLLIENSAGTDLIRISDVGAAYFETANYFNSSNYQRSGGQFRFYDSTNSNYLRLFHGGASGLYISSADNGHQIMNLGYEGVGINTSASSVVSLRVGNHTSSMIPLLIEASDASDLFQVLESGSTKLAKYGSGTFTGTAAYTLAVDSSGNIIETSGGGSTPTLQEVTTAGNTTTNNVGIHMSNPVSALHVGDNNNTVSSALYSSDIVNISAQGTAPGLNIISAGTSQYNRGVFKATRSRGTLASPSAAVNADYVFSLLGAAYNGTSTPATAGVEMRIDGTVTSTAVPQRIEFQTGTGTTRSTRMTIKSDGDVGIGISNPLARLHARGEGFTSSTNALLIENSGGTDLLRIYNDGTSAFNGSININGSASGALRVDISSGSYPIRFSGSAGTSDAYFGTDSANNLLAYVNGADRLEVKSTGQLQLNNYGSGSFTGTATVNLEADSSGNVIERLEERGTFSGTTDSSGRLNIFHSIGSTPVIAIITTDAVGASIVTASVLSKSSTAVSIITNQISTAISGYYIFSD